MEIVVWTIEVGGHDGNVVGAVLKVVALAHLQSRYLCYCIFFIGIFEGRSEQCVFLHRLRGIFRIDAGGAEEKQLLDAVGERVAYDIALHLHVLHDEVGTV